MSRKSPRRRGRNLVEALESRVHLADISGTYTWQPIRIGAGGWADGIIISQSDPSVRFLRDDTGQAYRWDATRAEWMPLVVKNADGSGLPASAIPTPSHGFGADPRSFALDPNNNSVLYLYLRPSDNNTTGAVPFNVYKSTDGGRNFIATNFNATAGFTTSNTDDPNTLNVRLEGERLAVDPNNSNVVYIGTGTKGLFKSTDGGVNWTAMTGGGLPTGVDDMNVLPYKGGGTTVVNGVSVSSIIYLVTAAGNVYKSSNGGQAWTNITSGVGPTGKCEQATLDQNSGTLYVPTTNQNLWKYSGTTWSQIKTGGVDSVTVDPNNSNRLFAVLCGGGQVARSLNGGSTWTNLNFSYASSMGFAGTSHATWRSVSKIIVDSAGTVWQVEGNDGLLKWQSNDSTTNASWTPDVKGIENFCAMDIYLPNGNGGNKAYVTVQDENGLVINNLDDYSVTPIEPQTNLSNGTTVAVCPNDVNTFAMVSYDANSSTGSWSGITTNGGATYTTFKSMGTLPSALQEGNLAISRRGAWSAGSDHMVWLGGNIPYYSKDGGRTWTASSTSFGSTTVTDYNWRMDRELVADPFVADKYYVNFVSGGFWMTTDGGVTWTKLATFGSGGYLSGGGGYLVANYNVQNDLWLSSDQLYHSTDGGAHWSVVAAMGASYSSIALGAGSGKAGDAAYTIYMLYYNSRWNPASNYGVFRSTNGGASWDRIAYWPDGLVFDGNGEITTSMMAASWDTFGLVGMSTGGQGFVYGKLIVPSTTPTGVTLAAVSDTGVSNSDGLTKLSTALQFIVAGTVSGASVSIYDGSTLIGTATASGTTTTVTSTGVLTDGAHTITAKQLETGKSLSAASPGATITIDTVAPTGSGMVVNDGAGQRSMVDSLTITFNQPVTLAADALSLLKRSGATVPGVSLTAANPSGDQKTWVVTFSGSAVAYGSLPDGRYTLDATSAGVSDLAGNHLVADYARKFYRLFGDADGNRQVDRSHLVAFRSVLSNSSPYVWWLDYNADTRVDASDYLQFRQRLLKPLL